MLLPDSSDAASDTAPRYDGDVGYADASDHSWRADLPEAQADVGPVNDGSDVDTGPTVGPKVIQFTDETGDDGLPCHSVCSVFLAYGETAALQVTVMEEGSPVPQSLVAFTLVEAMPPAIVTLSNASSYSGAEGVVGANVHASSDHGPGIARLGIFPAGQGLSGVFDVVVTEDGSVPLSISTSFPPNSLAPAEVRVRLVAAASCAAVANAGPKPLTIVAEASRSAGWPVRFLSLPSLGEGEGVTYMALTEAHDAGGMVYAHGCAAVDLVGGASAGASIALNPVAPILAGDYALSADMVFGPEWTTAFAEATAPVDALLAGPAVALRDQICASMDPNVLTVLCPLLAVDGAGIGWENFKSLVDQHREAIVGFPMVSTVFSSLVGVRFEGELHMDPVGEGATKAKGAYEFSAFRFGPPGLLPCIAAEGPCEGSIYDMAVSLGLEMLPEASFSAFFDGKGLLFDQHPLELPLGGVIRHGVETHLFPGGGALEDGPGFPALIARLLGGASCGSNSECCAAFSKAMSKLDATVDPASIEEGCITLIGEAAAHLGDPLAALDSALGAAQVSSDGNCSLRFTKGAPVVEGLGTADEPCKWDVQMAFGTDALSATWTLRAQRIPDPVEPPLD